jgi:type IV secretory pathway VirB3-like protein
MDILVAVLAALLLYILLASAVVRVFQGIHRRDEVMREITAAWMKEQSRVVSH